MINFVVPYPMGFYAKTFDGRIDDPNGGWKGRGIWASAGNRTPFHVEGGKGIRRSSSSSSFAPIRSRTERSRLPHLAARSPYLMPEP